MELRDLAERKLNEMATDAMLDNFDSLTDEEKKKAFSSLLKLKGGMSDSKIADLLMMTYERSVKDNTDDFICLGSMITTICVILKDKGIITEEEYNAILGIPEKLIEESKKGKSGNEIPEGN